MNIGIETVRLVLRGVRFSSAGPIEGLVDT